MPLVELGGTVAKHLLDGAAEPPCLLLTPLEVGDRRLELLRALLDLAATRADERLGRLLVIRGREQRLEPVPDPVVGGLAPRPVLPPTISLRLF